MQSVKEGSFQYYLSQFGGSSPIMETFMFNCKCLSENPPPNSTHCETASSLSSNLAELAANQDPRSVVIYLTKTSYFNSDTMKYLVGKMFRCSQLHSELQSKLDLKRHIEEEEVEDEIEEEPEIIERDVETLIQKIELNYQALDRNFDMHPPCAHYMKKEYQQLMLTPYREFQQMTLWDFLVDSFKRLTNGSRVYGRNKVYDLAFKRSLNFCVNILAVDYEVSKIDGSKPLIMTCLKYNPERRTRVQITKLLETLFNTGHDFQMSVFNLIYLINQMVK